MTERIRVSATQINEFTTCQRRWVAGYILKDKQEQTEAMAFGTAGHKMLEDYAVAGLVPDQDQAWQFTKDSRKRYPGLSAKKALKHIPGPKVGRAEHGFSFMIKGIKFTGYIDREWEDKDGFWVTDYKFTAGYQNALTPESLQENIQAIIYATKAFIEQKIDVVNLRWVYMLSTKNPSARPISAKVTKKQATKHLQNILLICEEMIKVRERVKEQLNQGVPHNDILNTLPPTVSSCSKYAGCYYVNRCSLTPEQLIEGDFGTMEKSLLEKLEALKKDTAPAPPPASGPDVSQFLNKAPAAVAAVAPVAATKPGPDLSQFLPNKAPTPGAAAVNAVNKRDISQFLKTPATPEKNDTRKEPTVQLNAPENYIKKPELSADVERPPADKETTMFPPSASENTKTVTARGLNLTDGQKEVLRGVFEKLLNL